MINGNRFDWESIEVTLPSGVAIGLTEISYSDERPIEPRYGKGGVPQGFGRKNYKATGNMTLDREDADQLRMALGGSYYKGTFPVVVSYANDDQVTRTDVLPDCKITKSDTGSKQNDDNAGQIKLDFVIISPIKWNGVAAYGESGGLAGMVSNIRGKLGL